MVTERIKQLNPHLCIFGMPGSGLEYTCKLAIKDVVDNTDDQVIIIDCNKNYVGERCHSNIFYDLLNYDVVDFENNKINLFNPADEIITADNYFDYFKALTESVYGSLTIEQKSKIADVVSNIVKDGVDMTFSNVLPYLEKVDVDIAGAFKAVSDIFGTDNAPEIRGNIVIEVPDRNLTYLVAAVQFAKGIAKKNLQNGKRTTVAIHNGFEKLYRNLEKNNKTENSISYYFKTLHKKGRIFGCSIIIAESFFEDFDKYFPQVVANTSSFIILMQSALNRDKIENYFPSIKNFDYMNCGPGEGVEICGNDYSYFTLVNKK